MREINVLLTMDCEVPRPVAQATGPMGRAESERAIRGFAAAARERGLPPSFFIHPEAAADHASLFLGLEAEGACLGLHLHPWKLTDGTWRAHLGGLTGNEQRTVLTIAAENWASALGRRPVYFRPGSYSANDCTFSVLVELGFRGGSVSAPERITPDLNAVWSGAPRDPHRAHAAFRQLRGRLPFANVPLTLDYETQVARKGRILLRDLRPDWRDADYRAIARAILAQLCARAPAVPVIMIVAHNDADYSDPASPVQRNLVAALDGIKQVCGEEGIPTRGTTIAEVCEMVLALPVHEPAFVPA